jgi:3-oxoadipate enol-lactonase
LTNSSAQQGFAEVNGARLYYEAVGHGRTVVLVHAGIADNRMWDDQFALFAQLYRVIRFDLRGFSQSTMPPGPFAFHDDLYELLRQLSVEHAALIGVSLGGMTALDLALTHPELVEALVLVGSGIGGSEMTNSPEEAELFSRVEAAGEAGDFDTANDLEVHIWVDGPGRNPEAVNSSVRERVRAMNLSTFTRHDEFEQAQPQPLEPAASTRLSQIRVPTLVIVGDQDVSGIQANAERLGAEIPGARKAVIPNTAHVPNMERPKEFNQIVLEFLASLGW